MMKWVIFGVALLAMTASIDAGGCHEEKPAYCARNHHLCQAEGFIKMMKKVCPRTCGYCKYDTNSGCHEEKPAYCARNHHLCQAEGFIKMMKKVCPRTCGYCKYDTNSKYTCSDRTPIFCARHKDKCKDRAHIRVMKIYCKKTCGYNCTASVTKYPCHDRAPIFCSKHKNECKDRSYIHVMKIYCKKTCDYCTASVTTPQPHTLSPGPTSPPYTGKCGVPEVKGVRVIAGTTPPRGAWPWQILLTYKGFATCGGTLISPEWVVCAAHCVSGREGIPSRFVVRVGEFNRTITEGSEVDVTVAKIIRHPKYSRYTLNNDISLLKLSRPVMLGKYVQPACFPSTDPPVGSKCYITGWGKTHHPGHMTTVLQQGLLPVVSNKVCFEKNRHRIHILITKAMICGGSGGTDRISGCHGDSGGPFVCNINGKWELHGSVSHGSPVCKSTETYTVFSRTNYFKGWIKDMMATH